jgi:CubicO group peptidase (beta-lactamase class C family)
MANLELGASIAPSTVFDIGSTSKQFSAFAILLLEQDGKLDIEDDVRKYVPELPHYGPTITIKNCSTRAAYGTTSSCSGSAGSTGRT